MRPQFALGSAVDTRKHSLLALVLDHFELFLQQILYLVCHDASSLLLIERIQYLLEVEVRIVILVGLKLVDVDGVGLGKLGLAQLHWQLQLALLLLVLMALQVLLTFKV